MCLAWSVEEEKIPHLSQLYRERRSSRNLHRTLSADEEETLHLTQLYCMPFKLEFASNMERRRRSTAVAPFKQEFIIDRKAQKKRIQLSTPNKDEFAPSMEKCRKQ